MGFLNDAADLLNGDELVDALFDALGIWDSVDDSFGAFDKSYVSGREHYMGLHLGVCHEVDEVNMVTLDGRTAWSGVAKSGLVTVNDPGFNNGIPTLQDDAEVATLPVTVPDLIAINQPHLFGGEKKQGGALGVVDVLHGRPSQGVNPYLASKCGDRVPAYRGVLSLVFHSDLTSMKDYVGNSFWQGPIVKHVRRSKLSEAPTHHTGFYWGAMSPSVKKVAVKVFRSLEGWVGTPVFYPEKATITLDGVRHNNPIHMIYQCLTNMRWGMKRPYALINDANFRLAADTLYAEGFGLSMQWTGKGSIESFCDAIQTHMAGKLFLNPATGLYEITLYRTPTVEQLAAAPLFGKDQIQDAGVFNRPAWGETVNDLTLIYMDVDGEKIASIGDQNAANIAIQGCTVSETVEYYGIRNAALAERVLRRQLMIMATPAATVTGLKLTRLAPMNDSEISGAYALHEGAIIRLNLPEYRLEDVAFRIIDIDYDGITDTSVTVTVEEDIYSMPTSAYMGGPTETWVNPVRPATNFAAENIRYAPICYHTLLQMVGAAGSAYLNPEYAGFSVLAEPMGSADQVNGMTVFAYDTNTVALASQVGPTSMLCPTAQLDGALAIHDPAGALVTSFKIKNVNSLSLYGAVGSWAFINNEKVLCTALNSDPTSLGYLTVTVERGVLDTIPAVHADGDKLWWFNDVAGARTVSSSWLKGETPYLWVCANSTIDQSALSISTPSLHPTLVADWYAPYPPANVTFDGTPYRDGIGCNFELKVAGRNRLTQSNLFLAWDDTGVAPEAGTTLEVRTYDDATGLLLNTVAGIPMPGPETYYKSRGADGTTVSGVAWSRSGTAVTVTSASNGLAAGSRVNVSVSSDATAMPLGEGLVASALAGSFVLTGLNAGATSGTLTYTPTASTVRVEAQTVRGSVKSSQIFTHTAKLCGYGYGYGAMYGGNSSSGTFITTPGTVLDSSREISAATLPAPFLKFSGGQWWDVGGADAAASGLQPNLNTQLVCRVSSMSGLDGSSYALPIVDGHPSAAAPINSAWVAPPAGLTTVDALDYSWPTQKCSVDSTYTTGRYGRTFKAPGSQARASFSQVVKIPDASHLFVANSTGKLNLDFWFGTDVDGTASADVGRVFVEFLDQDMNILPYNDTTPTSLFDTGWLDAETDALFAHNAYQGGRWRPVSLTVPANSADRMPPTARYARLTFLLRRVAGSGNCDASFNLIAGKVVNYAGLATDTLTVAAASTGSYPTTAKLQDIAAGWAVLSDGVNGWAVSNTGRCVDMGLPTVMAMGAAYGPVCSSITYTKALGGTWVVNINAGQYIAGFASPDHAELGLAMATTIYSGATDTVEPLSKYCEVSWIGEIAGKLTAVGLSVTDPTKTVMYRSKLAVTSEAFEAHKFELISSTLPPAFSDIKNWVYHPSEAVWRVFDTDGDPSTGRLITWNSADGVTWTKVYVAAAGNTAKVSYPFLRRTGTSTWAIEILAGPFVFVYTGTWTITRSRLNPAQIAAYATAGASQWRADDTATYLSDVSASHNSIMLRAGQMEWTADTQSGGLGRHYSGATLGFDTLAIPADVLTGVTLVSPAAHPYGKKIAACGDLHSALSDAGYFNDGASSDVSGIFGRNAGKFYFEVVVAPKLGGSSLTPKVVVGLAAAAGPTEVGAAITSALLDSSGKLHTAGKLQCPGQPTVGTVNTAATYRVAVGNVVSVQADFTAKVIKIYIDGVVACTLSGSEIDTSKMWFPVFSAVGVALNINLGQKAFSYSMNLGGASGFASWL